jgi:hypothetical protein
MGLSLAGGAGREGAEVLYLLKKLYNVGYTTIPVLVPVDPETRISSLES